MLTNKHLTALSAINGLFVCLKPPLAAESMACAALARSPASARIHRGASAGSAADP